MPPHVLYEKKDHIAYITLNRPEVMNAMGEQGRRELEQANTDFDEDPEVRVAILTGAGDRAFCTGMDLKEAAERARLGLPVYGLLLNRGRSGSP